MNPDTDVAIQKMGTLLRNLQAIRGEALRIYPTESRQEYWVESVDRQGDVSGVELLNPNLAERVIGQMKRLAGLDLRDTFSRQEGSLQLPTGSGVVEWYISTLQFPQGEGVLVTMTPWISPHDLG